MLPKVPLQGGGFMHFKDFPQEIHPERLFVVNSLGDYVGKVVLDIGCGKHKSLPGIVGVDIEPVTDIQASAEKLEFDNNTVDIIISRHSFEHFIDPVAVLKEWIRVLKIGGKIIFVLPDHSAIDTMCSFISAGQHLHAYTQGSFKNLLDLFPELKQESIDVVIENWSFGGVVRKVKL